MICQIRRCKVPKMEATTFRQCPNCSERWLDKDSWEKDTTSCGTMHRDHSYITRKGKDSTKTVFEVQLDVRRHRCGGKMYNEGVILSERTERYSKPIPEEVQP